MRNKMLTRQQEDIFKLVSAFENRCLAGEKITVEAYLNEVKDKTDLDKHLLREYLESSKLALAAGKERCANVPQLTAKDIEATKSKLKGLLKEKQAIRTIEPKPMADKIQIAASGGKRKKK